MFEGPSNGKTSERFSFGAFELDSGQSSLRKNGVEVSLRLKSFQVLHFLLEHHGELVTKDQLFEAVWPDVSVTPDSINQCIVEIRKALNDKSRTMVRTLPRRGYLFSQDVNISVKKKTAPQRSYARTASPGQFAKWPERCGQVIAVLPFASHSLSEQDQLFVDGMQDELLARLTQKSYLKVVSRTSVLRYRDSGMPIEGIRRQISAGLVIEGGIQRAGRKVRINIQLIETLHDQHLWARIFDCTLTGRNLFNVQSMITAQVVDAIDTLMSQCK